MQLGFWKGFAALVTRKGTTVVKTHSPQTAWPLECRGILSTAAKGNRERMGTDHGVLVFGRVETAPTVYALAGNASRQDA